MRLLKITVATVAVSILCATPLLAVGGKPVVKNTATRCLKLGERESKGGIPGPDGWEGLVPCCDSLERVEPIDICGTGYAGGFVYTCVACGDGKCDKAYENNCNCPADCK